MNMLKMLGIALVACLALAGIASAQKWQSLEASANLFHRYSCAAH